MSSESSISIHIRRGDYISDSVVNNILGVISDEYYKKAINLIMERINKPKFYIFSDDISWVKQNFYPEMEKHIIDLNLPNRDVYELWLMSQCKHNIIANSSFSWWGAWLGNYPEKIVIAPEIWSKRPLRELSKIIPSSWVKVKN